MKQMLSRKFLGAATLALSFLVLTHRSQAEAVHVEVVKTAGGWQMLRAGQPFFIRGAGGDASLEALKAAGANSVRTWGADKLEPLLDQAQKLGMTVTVGIWLGQERQGFNYSDAAQVAKQLQTVREMVMRYKDHPAVLMWGLGNEMEGYAKGDNAAIWSAVNNVAEMVKKLDPNHPTMTVIAEIGGDRINNIHRLCPDIDVIGINSYGGTESIAERYLKVNGTKPYVITEFGPPGAWESEKTSWGAALEPSSTAKGEWYRRAYSGSIDHKPLCLGSYAFVWGFKQEATATWYGMFLPGGLKVQAVDTMTELWSGKLPAERCPAIKALKIEGENQVEPGAEFKVTLDASDPAGKSFKVRWILQPEQTSTGTGGDAEPELPVLTQAILQSDVHHAEVRAPQDAGGYRLFAYLDNGFGAAVANVPFQVKGTPKLAAGKTARMPFVIFADQEAGVAHYFPSGWMGNTKAIKMEEASHVRPHSGATCIRAEYQAAAEWGGVVWQDPVNDWGDEPGGWNLSGAKRLVFWARGEKGGETVGFKFGLLGRDKKYPDTAFGSLDGVKLTADWKEYSIDLADKDLTCVKTGFAWTAAGQGAPVVFYLDDIRYE
jgi:hypothetical protein